MIILMIITQDNVKRELGFFSVFGQVREVRMKKKIGYGELGLIM